MLRQTVPWFKRPNEQKNRKDKVKTTETLPTRPALIDIFSHVVLVIRRMYTAASGGSVAEAILEEQITDIDH